MENRIDVTHPTREQLNEALSYITRSPKSQGQLQLIVIRPEENQRQILERGQLDPIMGLVGDNWSKKPSSRTKDGSPHPDMQINIMNSRAAQAVAGSQDRWSLAGDQLYTDLDLSEENLPPGTQLKIGEATLVVTDQPHRGCKKFSERFGLDSLKFVNSKEGRIHNLRGINARVVNGVVISTNDTIDVVRKG